MAKRDVSVDDDDPIGGSEAEFIRLQEMFLPVHGFVRLYPSEIAIINHPSFQRLRNCRQLGFAHYVFPGASHTRFEHSIGAVHVAKKIIDFVRFNYGVSRRERNRGGYALCGISEEARRFIRLGALLHDIGHIPLGHTLEDELEHLPKHDGEARVDRLCNEIYRFYNIDQGLSLDFVAKGGWSLKSLINALYAADLEALYKGERPPLSPYDVVKLITLKPPKDENDLKDWNARTDALSKVLPVAVCRDIIGNTICADFLDYIFRDWFHVGKPQPEDRRLYQYMEVRERTPGVLASQEFVINVGTPKKLRHDALTMIFELLESRYKLAETVLFHRTKLAMTALLDRCFLELRYMYAQLALSDDYLAEQALELLLHAGDDDLPAIIRRLANGDLAKKEDQGLTKAIEDARANFRAYTERAATDHSQVPQKDLLFEGRPPFDIDFQQALIDRLAQGLEERTMYTLACKIPRRSLDPEDRCEPEKTPKRFVGLLDPNERRKQIVMLERRFDLPAGSVTLYAPQSAKMNAKIAAVKLLIKDEITEFAKYENDMKGDSLSGGLLQAQINRFYELWGVSIYVERSIWYSLPEDRRADFERALRAFMYLNENDRNHRESMRESIEPIVALVTGLNLRAARNATEPAPNDEFASETFNSGLPYSVKR